MAILLMVLKIIGIVLLVTLGLIVLICTLVLFVPVRYEFKGSFTDTYDFTLRISWLLRFVKFKLIGQNKTITNRITILGIQLKKKEKVTTKNDESISENDKNEQKEIEPVEKIVEEPKENFGGYFDNQEEFSGDKKGIFTKIKEGILSFIQKVKQTISKICDTIKSIREKIRKADEFIHNEQNRIVYNLAKNELFYLIRHYKPRKWRGKLLLGTGDPASTGYALGALYAFYPVHGGNLIVTPDFDNKTIQGNMYIKGRIRGIHALRSSIHLLMNKHFRNMIFKKNGGTINGRK